MTLIELIKNGLKDEDRAILPHLDFLKNDDEIIESIKSVNLLNFDNNHENQETEQTQ